MNISKCIKQLATITALVIVSSIASASIAQTVVVVHPSNTTTFDENAVRRIFLGKIKSFDNGTSVKPINLKPGDPVRDKFDRAALNKSSSQVKSYWSKLLFTGKGTPPKEVSSATEAKQMVSTNPEAIAYIDQSMVDSSVKVVATFN